jgi:hypothetical protein
MKARRFDEILRARGFKCRERPTATYAGKCVYVKEHLYNKIVCEVDMDTHGKGQNMMFNIYGTLRTPTDMEEFKKANLDREFLYREALKIHEAFETLKQMKGKKHLYCF